MKNEEHSSAIAEINKKKLRLQATLRNIEESLSDVVLDSVESERDRSTLGLLRTAIVKVVKGALTAADNESLFHKLHMLKLPGQSKDKEVEPKEIAKESKEVSGPHDINALATKTAGMELEIVDDPRNNNFRNIK